MSKSAEEKKAKRLAKKKKQKEMLNQDNDKNRSPSKYAKKKAERNA